MLPCLCICRYSEANIKQHKLTLGSRGKSRDGKRDEDDDEEGEDELLTGMRRRTRHQYDERIEDDDVAGIETVSII